MQRCALDALGIPFWLTVPVLTLLIWAYSRRSGIKTLVWTDALQTVVIIVTLVLLFYHVAGTLGMSVTEAMAAVAASEHSRIFVVDDLWSTQNFFKQFVSGAFIVVVMTGLDQNMMQKNLTCRNLREAQKNMCVTGLFFAPVNLLFLSLGVLLIMLLPQLGMELPARGDDLLPMAVGSGRLGGLVAVLFVLGVFASSSSTADSSLAALTTSLCVDIFNRPDDERLRKLTHMAVAVLFVFFILAFHVINSTSLIDAVYILVSYTYGPLLGLYAYGLFTRRTVCDRLTPVVCVGSPLLCFVIDSAASRLAGYHFGYELLLLNAMLTIVALYLSQLFLHKQTKPAT